MEIISPKILAYQGRMAPEESILVGYGALIEFYKLQMPLPIALAIIGSKSRNYTTSEWKVFTISYKPEDTLYGNLVFALKYEGINLLFFKKLFEKIKVETIEDFIKAEPYSQYSRRIWFLYEWLMQKQLNIPDVKGAKYFPLVDGKLQYASSKVINSSRHGIKNNLPGTVDFCPLIHKTPKLEEYIEENLSKKTSDLISGVHKDILLRTSAFLLLKDSKASFTIEGETPVHNRAVRWGKAIGQAGSKPLSKDELLRLQQIVIENSRFVKMGYRTEGGFVGEHDRVSGEPIPEHISARWQDVEKLMAGLMGAANKMEKDEFYPVLTAAKIAFGFVFIHPFVDGNGRLHRYLIHHLLSVMKLTQQGIIFPVSAAILERIDDYRKVLESYSHPLLNFIEWKKTDKNNVEVANDIIDFYRYFDATTQAEFLYECVKYTVEKVIPEEVEYLQNFDKMKNRLNEKYQMPDKLIALLIRFLEQNKGTLSNRAKEKEFEILTEKEVREIEDIYKEIFVIND
ncbi:MAG: Fic family protein [Ignavibacteriae bacterium]|nr:Fic family protein [Ignavibacteriota bacterium]